MWNRRIFAILLPVLISAAAYSQETVNYASVSGRVTDPSGAVVEGAAVTARQTDTNVINTAVTDHEGRFRFPYLKIGPYEIKVGKSGFGEALRSITLTIGAAFEIPVTLSVGSTASNITVSGDAPVLEAARTQIAGTVSQTEVRNLPLNGRNFLDLALLIPGVSPTNTAANQLFAETSAVPGQGISVGSQRNFSNSFIVDGLSDERRRGRPERDFLRPGCRAGVSGGHLRRAGGVRARAGRLHQRGHQERHEYAARRSVRLLSQLSG